MFPAQLDQITRDYLHAKDHNRPHALGRAFAEHAVFVSRFEFETDFSDDTPREGLGAITDTFRQLGAACENIYTLCTLDSRRQLEVEAGAAPAWACKWIVTMSDRESGKLRAAWGDYRWEIDEASGLATELIVTMVEMCMLEPEQLAPVSEWMAAFEGPWVEREALIEAMPKLDELAGVARYL